jgi:hypothetical protein
VLDTRAISYRDTCTAANVIMVDGSDTYSQWATLTFQVRALQGHSQRDPAKPDKVLGLFSMVLGSSMAQREAWYGSIIVLRSFLLAR